MPLTSYIYDFRTDEAALSDNGNWATGAPTNFWHAPKVSGGVCCASVPNDADSDDSFAFPDPTKFSFGSDYYLVATVRRAANYVNTAGHEIELLAQIATTPGAPGTARLIECTFQYLDIPSSQSLQLVIWTGQPGQFDTGTLGGSTVSGGFEIRDGDELAIRKAGTNFFIYHNDVQVCTFVNNTFPNGSPGIGHFMRSGGTDVAYGWRKVAVTAGANTIFVPSQVYAAGARNFPITNIDPSVSQFKVALSRESWAANAQLTVNLECALNGVNFQHVAGDSFGGGDFSFKGRPVTHSRFVCGIPGVGTTGRAVRVTFQNSVSLRTAVSGMMF